MRELASLRDDQAPDHPGRPSQRGSGGRRPGLDEMNATPEPVHDAAVRQQLEALATRLEGSPLPPPSPPTRGSTSSPTTSTQFGSSSHRRSAHGHRPGGRQRARHPVAEAALPRRPPQRGHGNERRGDAGNRSPPHRAGGRRCARTRPAPRRRSFSVSSTPGSRHRWPHRSRSESEEFSRDVENASPPPRRSRKPAARPRAMRRLSTICSNATG